MQSDEVYDKVTYMYMTSINIYGVTHVDIHTMYEVKHFVT